MRILPAIVGGMGFILAHLAAQAGQPGLEFTPEERQWLATKPHLRVGSDPNWPPFSTHDTSGKLRGIDRDVLDLISQRTGIVFDIVPARTWDAVEKMAREQAVDVLTGTAQTPEREKFAHFTRPYFLSSVAIITRKDAAFCTSIPQLAGCVVAAPRGHVSTEALAREYPTIKLSLTDSMTDALRAVNRGQADATVANLTGASYTILNEGLDNLKIAGLADYMFDLRLGVTQAGPALSVLDKAIASISRRELAAIQDRWVGTEFQQSLSWRAARKALLWAGGITLLLVLLFLARNFALARELAERRRVEKELSAANQKLEALNKEKTAIMQMLAHDLNNPLGTLSMICDAFHGRFEREHQDLGDVRMMRTSLDRMTRLVRGLLCADAIENGTRALTMQMIDLSETARTVIERLRHAATAKQINLRVSELEPCPVSADPLALEQVVENIVANAIKFTPPGGTVEASVESRGNVRELRVADTGPGVQDSERGHLFRKFHRLSAQPTAGESSHGIGLMIVKRLIEAMRGSVIHEHRPGGGSIFTVRL